MGNYLSTAELLTRFPDDADAAFFTDDEGAGAPTADHLNDIIEAAEGMINSRIGKLWATPVDVALDTELSNTLKRHTLDLAEALMVGGRSERLSEVKQGQLDRVLEWADRIGDGTYVLPGGVTPAGPTSIDPRAAWSGSNRTLISTSPRIFTRDSTAQL